MRIWLINHYAVPPQYYPLARPSLFAKNLMKMGHEVVIIAASTVHPGCGLQSSLHHRFLLAVCDYCCGGSGKNGTTCFVQTASA